MASNPAPRTAARGTRSRSTNRASRMSLTSRENRFTTGPVPSVGSDDWPSRYIWRWIWRRNAVASGADRLGQDRTPELGDQAQGQEQDQARGQQGRQGADVVPQRRDPADHPLQHPGTRAVRWVRAPEVPRHQRNTGPCCDTRQNLPSVPATGCGIHWGKLALRSIGNLVSPWLTSSPASSPATASSDSISSECTTPRTAAFTCALGLLLIRSLRARPNASACIRQIPSARGGVKCLAPPDDRALRVTRDGPGAVAGALSVRPGRDPRTRGTRTTRPLHCTTRNIRVPELRTPSRG